MALSADWLRQLLDHIRSITVECGPGLMMNRTPTGTVISAIRDRPIISRSESSRPLPFDCKRTSDGVSMYLPVSEGFVTVTDADGWHTASYIGVTQGQGSDGNMVPVRDGDWVSLPVADREYFMVLLHDSTSSKYRWTVKHGGHNNPQGMTEVTMFTLVHIAYDWSYEQKFHGAANFDFSQGDGSGRSIDGYVNENAADVYQPWRLQLHDWTSPTNATSCHDILVRDAAGGELKYMSPSSLGGSVSNYIDASTVVNNIISNPSALQALSSYIYGEILLLIQNNPGALFALCPHWNCSNFQSPQ